MRNFSTVYYKSKEKVNKAKSITIDNEHKELLEAIKREFGFNNFNILNESEKEIYKSLVLEYWSPKDGINKKGIKFINESKITLSPESNNELIKKIFQREIKSNIDSYVLGVITNNTNGQDPSKIKKMIEDEVKHKISNKDCKIWLLELMSAYLENKINKLSF